MRANSAAASPPCIAPRACPSPSTWATCCRCWPCARCSTTGIRWVPNSRCASWRRPSAWRASRPKARQSSSAGGATTSSDVAEADYLLMVLKKTCWLATIHPSRMGALIGSRGAIDLDRCIRFGFFLRRGLSDSGRSAQPGRQRGRVRQGDSGGDIREGKRTLMLIRPDGQSHRRGAGAAARPCWIAAGRNARMGRSAGCGSGWMHTGAATTRARWRTVWRGPRDTRSRDLYGALPDSRDKRFLEALPAWVIERN